MAGSDEDACSSDNQQQGSKSEDSDSNWDSDAADSQEREERRKRRQVLVRRVEQLAPTHVLHQYDDIVQRCNDEIGQILDPVSNALYLPAPSAVASRMLSPVRSQCFSILDDDEKFEDGTDEDSVTQTASLPAQPSQEESSDSEAEYLLTLDKDGLWARIEERVESVNADVRARLGNELTTWFTAMAEQVDKETEELDNHLDAIEAAEKFFLGASERMGDMVTGEVEVAKRVVTDFVKVLEEMRQEATTGSGKQAHADAAALAQLSVKLNRRIEELRAKIQELTVAAQLDEIEEKQNQLGKMESDLKAALEDYKHAEMVASKMEQKKETRKLILTILQKKGLQACQEEAETAAWGKDFTTIYDEGAAPLIHTMESKRRTRHAEFLNPVAQERLEKLGQQRTIVAANTDRLKRRIVELELQLAQLYEDNPKMEKVTVEEAIKLQASLDADVEGLEANLTRTKQSVEDTAAASDKAMLLQHTMEQQRELFLQKLHRAQGRVVDDGSQEGRPAPVGGEDVNTMIERQEANLNSLTNQSVTMGLQISSLQERARHILQRQKDEVVLCKGMDAYAVVNDERDLPFVAGIVGTAPDDGGVVRSRARMSTMSGQVARPEGLLVDRTRSSGRPEAPPTRATPVMPNATPQAKAAAKMNARLQRELDLIEQSARTAVLIQEYDVDAADLAVDLSMDQEMAALHGLKRSTMEVILSLGSRRKDSIVSVDG